MFLFLPSQLSNRHLSLSNFNYLPDNSTFTESILVNIVTEEITNSEFPLARLYSRCNSLVIRGNVTIIPSYLIPIRDGIAGIIFCWAGVAERQASVSDVTGTFY